MRARDLYTGGGGGWEFCFRGVCACFENGVQLELAFIMEFLRSGLHQNLRVELFNICFHSLPHYCMFVCSG